MNGKQKRILQSLRRVQAFVSTLAAEQPDQGGGSLATPLAALSTVVARLSTHAVVQDTGRRLSKADTKRRLAAMRVLREHHMRPIAHLARTLVPTQPGITDALALPRVRTDAEALVTAAGSMANAAEPYVSLFVAHGLAPDFVAQLGAAADVVRATVAGRASNVERRSGATAGLRADLADARRLVGLLDALVTPLLETDATRLTEWRTAKRVVAGNGAGSPAAPAVPPAIAPAVAPAAAPAVQAA